MPVDKQSVRSWHQRVIEILNREWDPIGDCPEDEYESYAWKLAAMIRDHATREQMIQYLEWAETEKMGLGRPFNRDRAERVIAAVVNLGPLPKSN